MKTVVHVNQHAIRKNYQEGSEDPVLTVKTYKDNRYASEVEVLDKNGEVVGRFVYRPTSPLSCGARVWFETENEVTVVA